MYNQSCLSTLFSKEKSDLERQNILLKIIIAKFLKQQLGDALSNNELFEFVDKKVNGLLCDLVNNPYQEFSIFHSKWIEIACIQFQTDAIKYDTEKKKEYINSALNSVKKTIKNWFR